MDEERQQLIELLDATMHITDETREQIEAGIEEALRQPQTFQLLCDILIEPSTNNTTKHAATIYINKIIENIEGVWDEVGEEEKAPYVNNILALVQAELPESVLHTLLNSVLRLYGLLQGQWDDIFNLFTEMINGDRLQAGIQLITTLLPVLQDEIYSQIADTLVQASLMALGSDQPDFKFQGLELFISMYSHHQGEEVEFPEHVALIFQMISIVNDISIHYQSKFWNDIESMVFHNLFDEEQISVIFNKALEFAESDIEPTIRSAALNALLPAITQIDEIGPRFFSASLEICASQVENTEELPDDLLTQFVDALRRYPHEEVYPIIQEIITENIEKEDVPHQTAALLIFRTVMTNARECALKDIDGIVNFLKSALEPENSPLTHLAALKVINDFGDTFASINVYTPQFLENLIPMCASPTADVRHESYQACQTILDDLDSEIPELYDTVIEILDTLDDNSDEVDWGSFLNLLTYAIRLTEELDDEAIDKALELIEEISQDAGDNMQRIHPLFMLGHAVIAKDRDQAETVLDLLREGTRTLFHSNHEDLVFSAMNFLRNLAITLQEEAAPFLEEYVEPMIAFLKSDVKDKILSSSVETLTMIIRWVPPFADAAREAIMETIETILGSDNEIAVVAELQTIRILKNGFDPDLHLSLFRRVCMILIKDQEDEDIANDCFYTLAKMLKYAPEEHVEEYLSASQEIVVMLQESTLPLLKETELIKSPFFPTIALAVEHFFAAILRYPVPFADELCEYLLDWLEEGIDFEAYDITGSFIEAIKADSISEETLQAILSAVTDQMETTTDPGPQQNIVYFLNVILQQKQALQGFIIELLPKIAEWYEAGKEARYGYQDTLANIASLYLAIAKNFPDFPEEMLVQAIEEFPPADHLETTSMAQAIISIIDRGLNDNTLPAVVNALARFVVWDEKNIEHSRITEELQNRLKSAFKRIVGSNQEILQEVNQVYGKQRANQRRLAAVLEQ